MVHTLSKHQEVKDVSRHEEKFLVSHNEVRHWTILLVAQRCIQVHSTDVLNNIYKVWHMLGGQDGQCISRET